MNENTGPLHVEYDGASPPLPEKVTVGWHRRRWLQRILPSGCHAFWFEPRVTWKTDPDPSLPNAFLGPLRIEYPKRWRAVRASADLYLISPSDVGRQEGLSGCSEQIFSRLSQCTPEEAVKALHFPLKSYRYYLTLDRVQVLPEGWFPEVLRLHFLCYRLGNDNEWSKPQPVYFDVPRPEVGAEPTILHNALGTPIGRIARHHLSSFARVAGIDVETLAGCEKPTDQELWDKALHPAGWAVTVKDVTKPVGEIPSDLVEPEWQVADLRTYLKSRVKKAENDPSDRQLFPATEPWQYSLQTVPQIYNGGEAAFGYMYATRPDHSRKGAAVAAHAPLFRGSGAPKLQGVDRLFHRVAIHELGHMQGLYHGDMGALMQPGLSIRRAWRTVLIRLRHSVLDEARLRHLPDCWVRPGGLPFGHGYRSSAVEIADLIPLTNSSGCVLEIKELKGPRLTKGEDGLFQLSVGDVLEEIGLQLTSQQSVVRHPSEETIKPPFENSIATVALVWPSGRTHTCITAQLPPLETEQKSDWTAYTIHLLEGLVPDRPVLNTAGIYQLTVELLWAASGQYHRVAGEATIHVRDWR